MFKKIVRNQIIKTLKNLVNFNGQPITVKIIGQNVNVNTTITRPEEALQIIKDQGSNVDKNSSYEITLNDQNKVEKLVYTGQEIMKLLPYL